MIDTIKVKKSDDKENWPRSSVDESDYMLKEMEALKRKEWSWRRGRRNRGETDDEEDETDDEEDQEKTDKEAED